MLNPKKINKIIYTSSSSVYGSVNDNLDQRDNEIDIYILTQNYIVKIL